MNWLAIPQEACAGTKKVPRETSRRKLTNDRMINPRYRETQWMMDVAKSMNQV